MTNKIEKDSNTKERILAFKLSQEFTEEDLKEVSGAANNSYGSGTTYSSTKDPRTGQENTDAHYDGGVDF